MPRSLTLAVLLLLSTSAAAQFDALSFSLGPIERIEESDIAHSFGTLRNSAGIDVRNVTVAVVLRAPRTAYIGGQSDAFWTCRNGDNPYVLYCTAPLIRAFESVQLQVYVGPVREMRVQLEAHASGQWFEATLYTQTARASGSFPRDVIVSNTGDPGVGSLRAAIEYANDACSRDNVPCRIAFRIDAPVPERGWYTIYPNAPLPAITAPDIEIDGATQTRFTGDTNPLGPEIALDGAAVWTGPGLQLTGGGLAAISNLSIGGFPGDGIAVARTSSPFSTIRNNHIRRNGSRGISFDVPTSNFEVTGNVITENARSGVFVSAAYLTTVAENTIRANGAAGVFVGPQVSDFTLRGNSITHNNQFGVAIAREVARFALIDNSITRNGFIGIDRGLDGFSGYDLDDNSMFAAKIPPPRVVAATYDAVANATTIAGTYYEQQDHWGSWKITLFRSTVNDGQGEAVVEHTGAVNGTFRVTVPGNLTGQFITATGQRYLQLGLSGEWFWTSEFSESVEVR